MAKKRTISGFTVIEMVVTIVVLGSIFIVGAKVMGRAFESYDLAQRTTDVDWQGRVALERMARELRTVRSATATDLSFAASPMTEVRFIDSSGNSICYRLSGTILQRSLDGPSGTCGTTSAQSLADNVTSLKFYYYANDGSDPSAVGNVFYITMVMTVTEGNASETYRTTVQPRNF